MDDMKETEIVEQTIKRGIKEGCTEDEWIVSLLSAIAHSLGVIADALNNISKGSSI